MAAGTTQHDSKSVRRRRFVLGRCVATLALGLATAACNTSSPPAEQPAADVTSDAASVGGSSPVDVNISIDPDGARIPFDRRLLGTNLPAWLGPDRLNDQRFQDVAVESGTTLIRMPGGSWSNAYDWLACENRDPDGCYWLEAARPTDFIDFLQATGIDGMWTVSINESAQQAAAAVAFFNGSVADDTPIGVDRSGADWETVGHWAALRAANGNPDPIGIALWEVGNEVYGGRPDAGGEQCASFGWEDVWTCDGVEYVTGDADHDGYLAFRAAMRAVDPDIEVGAVGVGDPEAWSNWGNEVIAEAGDEMDFYVVHQYGFDESPAASAALAHPMAMWPGLIGDVRDALGSDIAVAVTEYNLVSVNDNDPGRTMIQAMNALYIADTIGQLAAQGVTIANQWNLANGLAANGTDYGLVDADDYGPYPQFEALARWSAAGTNLLPAAVDNEQIRVYATRHDNDDWTIFVLNLAENDETLTLGFTTDIGAESAQIDSVWADDPSDTAMRFGPAGDVAFVDGRATLQLPAWSINTVSISADSSSSGTGDTSEEPTDD